MCIYACLRYACIAIGVLFALLMVDYECSVVLIYTYPAWAFGVARFDKMGSPEPLTVKRAIVQGFTLFLCLNLNSLLTH